MSRIHLIVAGVLGPLSLALLWLTDVPLGIPGEWTWDRTAADDGLGVVLGLVQAAVFGALVLAIAWLGNRRIQDASKWEVAAWLLGLMGGSFAWLVAVQDAPAEGYRLNKAPWVLYYSGSSGYFDYARHEVSSGDELLAGYEDLMNEGDVLHQGTHPPGLFMLYHSLILTVNESPSLSEFAHWTMPQSALDGFATLEENTIGSPKFPTQADQAVMWWAFLLTQVSSVFVIVPLFFFLRINFDRTTAWRCISLWPFVPAIAIFLPKSDVLFTGVAMSLVATWCWAARRNSLFLGAIAGAIGFLGLFCSLAFLPIGLIAVVISCLSLASNPEQQQVSDQSPSALGRLLFVFKQQRLALCGGLAGVLVPLGVLLLWDINLLTIWRLNYANHAGFYDEYPRSFWLWRLVNPFELALAVGLPVMVLVADSIRLAIRDRSSRPGEFAVVVATVGVWGMLWISGKNSGEAARLWIPLMPLFLACVATFLKGQTADSDRRWLLLLVVQAVVAMLTVIRITGFKFD